MNFFRPLIVALLLLFSFSCTPSHRGPNASKLQEWMSNNGKLKVLCTTSMIADLVQEVGMEHIDCLTLIQGESDPHSYQLVKGDDEKLSRADLIFYNGLGLEHGPSLALRLRDNSKAFSIGDFLSRKRPENIITYNGSLDPHIWMDVSLWQQAVPFICEKLVHARPEQAEDFETKAKGLSLTLKTLHKKIRKTFQSIPESSRYLVSSHEAFNYFVRAYLATNEERLNAQWRIRSMAPEGLAPDSQLSTYDIQRLVDHIIEFNITTLFAESNVSQDSLKKLIDSCSRKGHVVHIAKKPLYVDAMGPSQSAACTYTGMMSYDAEVISSALLKGKD